MSLLTLLRLNAPATSSCAATIAFLLSLPASAQTQDDASKILKAITDYVASQNVISATYDTDIEVITDNLQKISVHEFRSNAAQSSR